MWLNKGMALNELGKYEEAIKCFDKALALEELNTSSLFNKGIALAGLGKYDESIKCFDKVLSVDRENKDAKTKKEEILNMMKNR
ncbi:MAG: tetratricopeptide repeat protein [Candidatus Eremiobacterota bacterium]